MGIQVQLYSCGGQEERADMLALLLLLALATNSAGYQIFLKGIDGKTFVGDVSANNPTCKMLDLVTSNLAKKSGKNVEEIRAKLDPKGVRVVCGTKQIDITCRKDSCKTMAQAGVREGCTCRVLLKLLGGMVGARVARREELKPLVRIVDELHVNGERYGSSCGGTLIDAGGAKFVITAAHCVQKHQNSLKESENVNVDPENPKLSVDLGRRNMDAIFGEAHEKIKVVRVRLPPNVKKVDPYWNHPLNDIALLELEHPPRKLDELSDKVAIAVLGNQQMLEELTQSETPLRTGGWGIKEVGWKTRKLIKATGTTSIGTDVDPAKLQIATDVRLIRREKSVAWFQKRYPNNDMTLKAPPFEGQLTATQADVSTCQGDSGGPLFHRDPVDGAYYLIGVVSWGQINVDTGDLSDVSTQKRIEFGPCVRGSPNVFTSVPFFRDWITDTISQLLSKPASTSSKSTASGAPLAKRNASQKQPAH